jgi:serine/threonine-protein kinase
VLGTPLFMSPESIQSPETIDSRSDLYALAAVGYFLVTGQPPFSGGSVVEICVHHARTPPTRPSEKLGRPVVADLEAALLKGLAKKPEERFASAREFAEALAACADAAAWTPRAADEWWRMYYPDNAGATISIDQTNSIHGEQTLITTAPALK